MTMWDNTGAAAILTKLLMLLPLLSRAFLSESSVPSKHEWMENIALNTGCYSETLSLYDHMRLMRVGSHFVLGDMHNGLKEVPTKVRIVVPVERIIFSNMTVKVAPVDKKKGAKQDSLVSPDFLPLHFMGLLRVAFASTDDLLYLWNDFNLLDVENVQPNGSEPVSKEAMEQNKMNAVTIRNEIRTLDHVAVRLGDMLNEERGSTAESYFSVQKTAITNIAAAIRRLCLGDGEKFDLLKDIIVTKNMYDSNEIRKTLLEMLFLDVIKEVSFEGRDVPPRSSLEMAIYKSYVSLVLVPLFLRRGGDAFNECALRNSTSSKRQIIYYNITAYNKADPTTLGIYASEQQRYTSIDGGDGAEERYSKRWMHSKALPAGSSINLTDNLSARLPSYTTMIMRCRSAPPSPSDQPSSPIQVCTNGTDTCSLVDVDFHRSRECRAVRFTLFPYNNIIAIAMSLSANMIYTGRPSPHTAPRNLMYDSSLCGGAKFSDLPRVLVAGLGGGEMPSMLAQKHSCLVVDVVEVSTTVYHAAEAVFGFTACGLETGLASLDFADWGGGSCRLNVIFSDFIEYMAHISAHGLRKYDFVISDVYNSTSIEWDGNIGSGVSNADLDRFAAVNNLKIVRSILKPRTGLLLTHLHHDSYYEGFFKALKHEFESAATAAAKGTKYLAVFKANSNSNVIVAAVDGFSASKKDFMLRNTVDASGEEKMCWPCADLAAFAAYSLQYALRQGYSRNIAYSQRFSATCIESYA